MLSRIRGTMVPSVSAYLMGCQGKDLVCQTPRSLGDVPERWSEPQRSTMVPMNLVARQAPRRLLYNPAIRGTFPNSWHGGVTECGCAIGSETHRASTARPYQRLVCDKVVTRHAKGVAREKLKTWPWDL